MEDVKSYLVFCVFSVHAIATLAALPACKFCPLGFTAVGSTCYHSKAAETDYATAAAYCAAKTATLVVFETSQELNHFKTWAQSLSGIENVWTDGELVGGAYQWKSTGGAIDGSLWGNGQPDLNETNVIASSNATFLLDDTAASATHSTVCEIVPDKYKYSTLSATTAGAEIKVTCPTGCQALSCDCELWENCRGSKFLADECAAYNKNGGQGVRAKIQCAANNGRNARYGVTVNQGGYVLEANTSCPQGTTMTGCSSYTTSDSGQPPMVSGDQCVTNGSCTSVGCMVQARCQVLNCGDPGPFSPGTQLTGNDYYVNGSVSISCLSGYSSQGGATTADCLENGSWSASLQSCTENDECSSNPCQNGGACNDSVNMFSCVCTTGYDGDLCENAVTTTAATTTVSLDVNSTTPHTAPSTTHRFGNESFDLSSLELNITDDGPTEADGASRIGFGILALVGTLVFIMAIADVRTVYLDLKKAGDHIRSAFSGRKLKIGSSRVKISPETTGPEAKCPETKKRGKTGPEMTGPDKTIPETAGRETASTQRQRSKVW